MPVVTNYYSFSFNSQVFGGAGSPYQILSVDGLEGVPSIRNQDDNRGYSDGMFTGQDFYNGRSITMIVQTFGSGATSAQTNFNTLQSKLLPQTTGTTPLYFLLSPTGVEQFINARVRGVKTTIDPNYTYGMITSQIEFFCPFPFYFNNVSRTASLAISNPLGRTYNRTYNLVYGGGSYATTTAVTNDGWATSYPTITLNGPITNPTLGNVTQGYYLTFSGTYTNTDSLVINLQDKLITLNGNTARNLLTSGQWFSAPPGTSQFYLTGSSTLAGTTAANVQWYDSYI
jgi:phage-related protein